MYTQKKCLPGYDCIIVSSLLLLVFACSASETLAQRPDDLPTSVQVLLDTLPPLSHERQGRPLLYQYSVGDLSGLSDAETADVLQALANRGVGVITFWEKGSRQEARMEEGIRIARLQDSLGLSVAVDATDILYGFYDGTEAVAHIDSSGNRFFDDSFAGRSMGCPFTLDRRQPVIESRVAAYVEAYHAAGVSIDLVTADWEIDGPHEWNEAWENARRCVRGRENIANIESFEAFQARMREMRSDLLKDSYVQPILRRYPEAKITNYAVYPNDGWRYWYDYFESPQPELPHRRDQEALYRPWYDEFTETGLTMAMPVVYTWYPTYSWYPAFESDDYRWFYNMLRVGSNAGKSTPPGIPIATFVHWHTTAPPDDPDPSVPQMSKDRYQELLWHLLLRGHDRLYSWCLQEELPREMSLLQEVYDASLEYVGWLEHGVPITFDVPREEGPVVSGLRWNDRVLVRRTDFGPSTGPVSIEVAGETIRVPAAPDTLQIIELD